MKKRSKNWRLYSLEQLENKSWGDPAKAPTGLVKRCMELSKIPLEKYTPADLRLMIGQKIALTYLVPLALEVLIDEPFIDTEFYEGDLLSRVLDIDTAFWSDNKDHWQTLNELIKDRRVKLTELNIDATKFDEAKFPKSK